MSIQLTPVYQPLQTRTPVTSAEITNLITAIASTNPPLITLPENKQYTDVISFVLRVLPTGSGSLEVVFK